MTQSVAKFTGFSTKKCLHGSNSTSADVVQLLGGAWFALGLRGLPMAWSQAVPCKIAGAMQVSLATGVLATGFLARHTYLAFVEAVVKDLVKGLVKGL